LSQFSKSDFGHFLILYKSFKVEPHLGILCSTESMSTETRYDNKDNL